MNIARCLDLLVVTNNKVANHDVKYSLAHTPTALKPFVNGYTAAMRTRKPVFKTELNTLNVFYIYIPMTIFTLCCNTEVSYFL